MRQHEAPAADIASSGAESTTRQQSNGSLSDAGNAAIARMIVSHTDELNLRATPHLGDNVIAHLAAGEHVAAEGETQHGFAKIRDMATQKIGWASTRYLTADGNVPVRKAEHVDGKDTRTDGKGPVDPKKKVDAPQNDDSKLTIAANPTEAKYKGVETHAGTHSVTGQLFVTEKGDVTDISPDDVRQGTLGDCYFLASLASVARSNPELIRKLIHKVDAHTYSVSLYIKGSLQTTRITDDFVKGSFKSGVLYANPKASGSEGPELWVMLFEKAYAVLKGHGSYQNIVGGWGSTGMGALLPHGANKFEMHGSGKTADSCFSQADAAMQAHKPCTAGSRSLPKDASGNYIFGSADQALKALVQNRKLNLEHEYSIRSVDMAAQTINLQNPHGPSEDIILSKNDWFMAFAEISIGSV